MEGACERRMYPLTAADYKLMEEIGNGLSATVYRAVCLPFKEVVAVKALDLERCNSNLEDIRREAVTMTLINHPNVLRAYCSFVVEQRLWVVMPFMAGGSCLQIMKSNFIDGFEEGVIATLLKETLKALEYLHRQGHIHRDVKAGNILVDGNGSVKLADFGVSACMFDTGDRQRTRKTFVGTPCWMAPEVMEQLHGYDFKADIWSFGITALELAHGHAPFSRYPPMKVLLMTLQNAPPGLDYERDKRFSKSFKEMIAMCLVKEPSKRPTAEKLLRHSFFKHARTPDYIYRHILEGLPPLGDRLRNLQNAEGARLAQQNLNFDEQEERSQTEYKRGVSAWNFDVEALKAQSALIPDDDDNSPKMATEASSSADSSPQPGNRTYACSPDKAQLSAAMQSMNVETANGNGGCLTASRNCPSSKPSIRCVGISGRKEPKHIGRFDVFEDDNILESPGWHGSPKHEQRRGEERDQTRKERDESESRKGGSGPLVPEKVVSGVRGRDEDHDREHRHGRVGDRGSFSGPLLPTGERPLSDHRPANGVSRATNGSKEGSEKGPAQKAPVLQKGRFSVTSDDGDFEGIPHVSSRRNLCSQGAQYQPPLPSSSSSNYLNGLSVPAAPMVPHLQNALQLAVMQQETIMQLLNGISPIDAANSRSVLKRSSFVNHGSELSMAETQSEREMEYLQQISELKSKLNQMLDERECLKKRNVSLERQLNAIYNKEEEERIRREEAAKEDG